MPGSSQGFQSAVPAVHLSTCLCCSCKSIWTLSISAYDSFQHRSDSTFSSELAWDRQTPDFRLLMRQHTQYPLGACMSRRGSGNLAGSVCVIAQVICNWLDLKDGDPERSKSSWVMLEQGSRKSGIVQSNACTIVTHNENVSSPLLCSQPQVMVSQGTFQDSPPCVFLDEPGGLLSVPLCNLSTTWYHKQAHSLFYPSASQAVITITSL